MPLNPAPPDELGPMIDGYQQAVQSFLDVVYRCRDDDWDVATSCPGWTVRDQLAHVVAVEAHLAGQPQDDVEPVEGESGRATFLRWMEAGVQQRRDHSGPELAAELEELLQVRLAVLWSEGLDLDTEVPSVRATTAPLGELLAARLMDIWVHEQDVREALRHPGNLDSPGASTFLGALEDAFPRLVRRRVSGLEPGLGIIVESTGPVLGRFGVRVEESAEEDDGIALYPLFTGHREDTDVTGPETPDPTGVVPNRVTIMRLSTDALTRRAAGRHSTADTHYKVVGDEALAERVLDAVVITP